MRPGAGEGEIVQVQGGHIIRATGRKDRHSKVCTAKGPRDRRVRLSAHTAIQFYDVQDRLGYDRPSKALDWLIKKAKSAIEKLAELPPFDPTAAEGANVELGSSDPAMKGGGSGGGEQSESSGYEIHQLQGHHQHPESFLPTTSPENPMGFIPHQDLCLSLQSFQNPCLIHGQSDPGNPNSNHTLFSVGFEPRSSGCGAWPPETNSSEMGRFSQLLAGGYGGEEGSFQSSFHLPPSIRAWEDLPMGPTIGDHHQMHHQQPSMAVIGAPGSDGIAGLCFPAQVHGGGEDVHGIVAQHYSRASSMSTDSSR